MIELKRPLLLVGCGKMGSALLAGWLKQGVAADQVRVVEPALDPARTALPAGIDALAGANDLPADLAPAVIVFAVKPQAMAEVLPHYARFGAAGTVYLSIAAGTPIRLFEDHFGAQARIVRVMPNTPAAIGRGMSVLCANAHVSHEQRELCGALMAAVGMCDWTEDEALMDAVTATSGSGPAYVFLLIECLAQAGVDVGLPEALAQRLALETVAGAGELARSAAETPGELRVNVTSPGGTTEAALKILLAEDGLKALMRAAVKAAEERGRELGA